MQIFTHENINRVDVLDERFYQVGEEYFPSVTTVLEAYPKGYWYAQWLMDVGHNAGAIRDRAAERGSNVHNAIEKFLLGQELKWFQDGQAAFALDEWQMICRFMEFWDRCVDKGAGFATETQLFSNTMKLGGTCDLVCKINGEDWLIDFKTSNSISKTNEIQLSCYKEMWDERNSPKIQRYGVLWLNAATRTDKEFQGKGWQIKEFTGSHDHNLALYGHLRALWDEENPNYSPKNLSYPNSFAALPEGNVPRKVAAKLLDGDS